MTAADPGQEAVPLDRAHQLLRRDTFETPMRAPHRHRSLEFNLVIDGSATYLLGDRRYELAPNTLVWLFPGQDHIMTNRSWTYTDWLGLIPQAILHRICTTPETSPLLATDPSGQFARRLSPDAAHRLTHLFDEVTASSPAAVEVGVQFAFLAAWDAYRTAAATSAGTQVHPGVVQAAALLRRRADLASVQQLAAEVGLSPHHLSRLFARQMGVSIARFRNEQRLHRFLRLRRADSTVAVTTAAYQAGFGSPAQLYRVFRQLTGRSPGEHLAARGTPDPPEGPPARP